MTFEICIRPVAGYLLREEFVFRVIWVTLASVALSLYFVPASTFAQGQGKVQKGFATAQEAAKAFIGAHKKANVNALVEILGPKGHRLGSSGNAVEDRN
jgi:hypothetical protein